MALPLQLTFWPKNDQILELRGLKDVLTSAYQNSATVTATLRDQFGKEVPGLTNLSLSYVGGSQGIYRGLISDTGFDPPVGGGYELEVVADAAGAVFRAHVPSVITLRRQS